MAPTSLEGRRRMEQEVMLAYLLQLNRYALENELITKEIYKKMEIFDCDCLYLGRRSRLSVCYVKTDVYGADCFKIF